jgi:hypothetical protein
MSAAPGCDGAKAAPGDAWRDLFWDQSRAGGCAIVAAVEEAPARLVRVLQIIVGTIAGGALAFAAVAAVLRSSGEWPSAREPLLAPLAVGLAAVAIVMWQLLPRSVAARGRRQIAAGGPPPPARGWLAELTGSEEGRLLLLYQSCTILGAAMLEGAALFACVAHLLEDAPGVLGLGVALALLILLVEFPTRGRAARWVAAQQRLLAEERSLPLQ